MGMRGGMGMDGSMGGPMGPMMGGMQAMPGQMFVLAPGKFLLQYCSTIVLGQLVHTLLRPAASCSCYSPGQLLGCLLPEIAASTVRGDLPVPVCFVTLKVTSDSISQPHSCMPLFVTWT